MSLIVGAVARETSRTMFEVQFTKGGRWKYYFSLQRGVSDQIITWKYRLRRWAEFPVSLRSSCSSYRSIRKGDRISMAYIYLYFEVSPNASPTRLFRYQRGLTIIADRNVFICWKFNIRSCSIRKMLINIHWMKGDFLDTSSRHTNSVSRRKHVALTNRVVVRLSTLVTLVRDLHYLLISNNNVSCTLLHNNWKQGNCRTKGTDIHRHEEKKLASSHKWYYCNAIVQILYICVCVYIYTHIYIIHMSIDQFMHCNARFK